jgi:hypothetical protein
MENAPPPSDQRRALLIEAMAGLCLLPGLGWIYAGQVLRGVMLLLFALIGDLPLLVEVVGMTGGWGLCCCLPPLYVLVALDVYALKRWFANPKPYTWRNAVAEGLGFLALIVGLVLVDIAALAALVYIIQRQFMPPIF